eukprot:168260-Rhodomonas_salina.10
MLLILAGIGGRQRAWTQPRAHARRCCGRARRDQRRGGRSTHESVDCRPASGAERRSKVVKTWSHYDRNHDDDAMMNILALRIIMVCHSLRLSAVGSVYY